MKKVNLLILSVLLLAGVWGCSDNKVNSVPKSEPYTSEKAISRGDIVSFEKVYNLDKFEQFITNLSSKKADNIRVTSYTDEGDPIFKDLKFDGNVISYSYDTSNDAFGGSNTGVRTDTCSEVTSKKNTQSEIIYSISGCTNNDSEIDYYLFRTKKATQS
ncbi:DUF4362 domain-containing protein [Paenibacillus sp. FSL R5-0914]|uniref:DUF4362 domain-containing protein n=1 Tax=Paenibacillus sp. FSL R5-0914 TaxID=2921665 RepID=UPI0030FC25C6